MKSKSGWLRHAWLYVCAALLISALVLFLFQATKFWAGTVGVVGLLLGCVVIFPKLLAPDRPPSALRQIEDEQERIRLQDDRLKLQNDIRTALLQAATGIALLVGVIFTWQQLQEDRKGALEDRDQAREELALARQGQVAERYTRAVDQLGHTNLDVRLGGIYGLEQIAKQSEDARLVVFEVLAAYVRQYPNRDPSSAKVNGDVPKLEDRAADVQAAVTVLGRRTSFPTDPQVNLRSVDLRRVDLPNANLQNINLEHAQLQAAFLPGAQLQRTSLASAILRRTSMLGANLYKVDGHHADLRYAILSKADLHGSKFNNANLDHAQFDEANLDTIFLRSAQLHAANFHHANLHKANLVHANLREADLSGAELQGANLQNTILDGAQLRGAKATESTKWPSGFDWLSAGVKKVKK
jgi:uncharacterized protein YjbI with pentapeptide repeats